MKFKKQKLRAQVKSRFYYIFWGMATGAVVSGQLLVASSYSRMARVMELFILEQISCLRIRRTTSNEVPSLDHIYLQTLLIQS